MPNPRCRRFTLWDALILIAATACGLGLTRGYLESQRSRGFESSRGDWWRSSELLQSGRIILDHYAPMWLATGSLTALAIRLKGPRPPFHRLMRQPGMVASVMALFSIVWVTLVTGRGTTVYPVNTFWITINRFFMTCGLITGLIVSGGWLTLCLAKARRHEPGWIDGLGRFLGASWIGLLALRLTIFWG